MRHDIDVLLDDIDDSIEELLAEVSQAEDPGGLELPDEDLALLTMPRLRGFRTA